MARKAAATEAVLIAPYINVIKPARAASRCTVVGDHEAAVVRHCSTPQCLQVVCVDHWVGLLDQDPELFAAAQWSCTDCEADSEADSDACFAVADCESEGEEEAEESDTTRRRTSAASRAPISCDNFLDLDQHFANVTSTQQRLLERIFSDLELAPGEGPTQR